MFTKVQLLQRCEITMAFYMFLGLTKAARLRMRVTGGHYPAPRQGFVGAEKEKLLSYKTKPDYP